MPIVYISLEKREKLRRHCNTIYMIYIYKICHDEAERVSQVHRSLKI